MFLRKYLQAEIKRYKSNRYQAELSGTLLAIIRLKWQNTNTSVVILRFDPPLQSSCGGTILAVILGLIYY
jgi:hypothetical protein